MHDIRALRDDPAAYVRGWSSRGVADAQGQVDAILDLDVRLRAVQTAVQAAQGQRNDASKLIGQAKAKKDEAEAARLMAQVETLKQTLEEQGELERKLKEELSGAGGVLASLPNLPAEDVPTGADEEENVELRRYGEPFAIASPKDHVDLGEGLAMLDFEAAGRMSGSRFTVLKKDLARLERALGQFMLDMQTLEHGYTEVSPPLLVRSDAMFGTGQLPKFEADLFSTGMTEVEFSEQVIMEIIPHFIRRYEAEIAEGEGENQAQDWAYGDAWAAVRKAIAADKLEKRYLIPTAEVSLTNLVREQITPEEELPLRLTALTPCFRSEAGASGRDTRGMIRQHQFYKVELVAITAPEQSNDEHERMIANAEAVLKALELPFRSMQLCTGDMGFSARRTVDLEVWLPSQGRYREISSISNCGDFQARRMDARCKPRDGKGTRFVHTLNGSGLAVGRTLVAIMENYQDDNGAIAIPQALHPYMRGLTRIERAA